MPRVNIEANQPADQPVIPSVPAPAVMPAGITSGIPPLPVGRVVTVLNPDILLPEERQILQKVGWVEGEPIPSNMAQIIAEVQSEVSSDVAEASRRPAIDPSTPPTRLNPKRIEELNPAKQAEVRKRMAEAVAMARQPAAAVMSPTSEVGRTIAESRQLNVPVAPVARPAPEGNYKPDPNYKPEPPQAINPRAKTAASQPRPAAASETLESGGAPLTHCPHCEMELAAPTAAEPTEHDKHAYLQTVIGEKPFTKDFELFGGQLIATFRVLTNMEIDAIYRQAYLERERKTIDTVADFYERVNRFRLYLQLVRLRTADRNGFDHEMPDGLSPTTNPSASVCWQSPDIEPLPAIEKYLLAHVLKNESLNRITMQNCAKFNQLVLKLETATNNPDFWKATA